MPQELNKLKEIYYQRMPEELRKELRVLNSETQEALLKVLNEYHHFNEEKTCFET